MMVDSTICDIIVSVCDSDSKVL